MSHNTDFDMYTYRAKEIRPFKKNTYVYDKEFVEGNLVVTPVLDYVIVNPDGNEFLVDKETICRPTAFEAYHRDENNKIIRDCLIYEKDIVEIRLHSGTRFRYLIWYCKEMNCFEAVDLSDAYFNGTDYHSNKIGYYEDFCLLMQDPWGDVNSVTVVGNEIDDKYLLADVEDYSNVNSDILDF